MLHTRNTQHCHFAACSQPASHRAHICLLRTVNLNQARRAHHHRDTIRCCGAHTPQGFRKIMVEHFGCSESMLVFVNQIFKELDGDSSGSLTFPEVCNGIVKVLGSSEEQLRFCFRMFARVSSQPSHREKASKMMICAPS